MASSKTPAAYQQKVQVKSKTLFMVETALMVAITLIMGLTPVGTIHTPFLSASIVTVPVGIAAMLLGIPGAIICGTVFGITSFINALTGVSGMLSTLFTVNPFGVFVTAVIARLLDGLFTGLIFAGLHQVLRGKLHGLAYYITGLCCPLLNTVFFMGSLVLFFYHSEYIQGIASNFGASNPFSFIIAVVGIQGIIEAVVGCVIAGTVGWLLSKALRRG